MAFQTSIESVWSLLNHHISGIWNLGSFGWGACFGCWDRWRELKYHPHGTVDNDRTRCNKMISANSQVIQKLKTKIPYGSWWNWNAFAFQSLFFLCAPILNSSVKGKKPVESKMLGCLSFSFLPWTKMNPNVEIGAQADLDVDLEIPYISIKIAFGFPLQRVLPRRALKNPKGPIGDFLHQQIRF